MLRTLLEVIVFAFTESIRIDRPRDVVFAFLTDPDRRAEWDRSVLWERLLTPPPVKVGSAIRTRMRVMGREVEFDWRVRGFDAPVAMAAESVSGMMPTRLAFTFAEEEGGCSVEARLSGEPSGMLRLVEPLVSETARSTLAAGLARAKALIEAEPG